MDRKKDIVKCPNPDCEASQQVWLDRQGDVACAFCGTKITDLPEGLDLEAYRAEQAAEPQQPIESDILLGEPEQTPTEGQGECVSISYALEYGDVDSALRVTEKIETNNRRQIIYTVIIGLFLIFEGFSIYNLWKNGDSIVTSCVLCAMMLVLLPYIWLGPKSQIKKYINSVADGSVITADIYEDVVKITTDDVRKPTKAELSEKTALKETDELFLLVLETGSVIVLPKRHFEGDLLETVTERLRKNTAVFLTPSEKKAAAKAERAAKKAAKAAEKEDTTAEAAAENTDSAE